MYSNVRGVAVALVIVMLAACTRVIDVPREQVEASSRAVDQTHKIRMVAGEEYCVESFWVTESTLVMTRLNPTDSRYENAELPISVPLDSVASVQRVEHRPPTWMIIAATGAFVVVIAALTNGEAFTD